MTSPVGITLQSLSLAVLGARRELKGEAAWATDPPTLQIPPQVLDSAWSIASDPERSAEWLFGQTYSPPRVGPPPPSWLAAQMGELWQDAVLVASQQMAGAAVLHEVSRIVQQSLVPDADYVQYRRNGDAVWECVVALRYTLPLEARDHSPPTLLDAVPADGEMGMVVPPSPEAVELLQQVESLLQKAVTVSLRHYAEREAARSLAALAARTSNP